MTTSDRTSNPRIHEWTDSHYGLRIRSESTHRPVEFSFQGQHIRGEGWCRFTVHHDGTRDWTKLAEEARTSRVLDFDDSIDSWTERWLFIDAQPCLAFHGAMVLRSTDFGLEYQCVVGHYEVPSSVVRALSSPDRSSGYSVLRALTLCELADVEVIYVAEDSPYPDPDEPYDAQGWELITLTDEEVSGLQSYLVRSRNPALAWLLEPQRIAGAAHSWSHGPDDEVVGHACTCRIRMAMACTIATTDVDVMQIVEVTKNDLNIVNVRSPHEQLRKLVKGPDEDFKISGSWLADADAEPIVLCKESPGTPLWLGSRDSGTRHRSSGNVCVAQLEDLEWARMLLLEGWGLPT